MNSLDKVVDAFITGDYFILFLVLILAVLAVLIFALIKSRAEYNELLNLEQKMKKDGNIFDEFKPQDKNKDDDILKELEDLMADKQEDVFDESKPLITQIDTSNIKTYDDQISEYERIDEENAVISAEELEQKAKERNEILGTNDNQAAIAKYEEEQEKKAIISYEQLLKNASNISLTYKKENNLPKDAPKVNKVEVLEKEVTGTKSYLEEEEFLKILKEFRISLNENIFD